tara:strand:- start:9 stop:827 length:819 start_codon:yes stop_codon:yes gene_type:complete
MNKILEKLGLKDGESIDHPWINKALERAQQKVEARNFDIRKTLLKFDNVLNDQRHVIFGQRKNVINSDEIFQYSNGFLSEIIENLVEKKNNFTATGKVKDFENQIYSLLGKSFDKNEVEDLLKKNNEEFQKEIREKFIKKRNQRIEIIGETQAKEIEKRIFLQSIDLNWKLHIQYLEQLRQVIGLRSYGQRDPLVEYKTEAFTLFENLLNKLKSDLVTILLNLTVIEKPLENEKEYQKPVKIDPKYVGKKMSRNEPCYCGSNKKYKHCCGRF